MKNLLRFLCLLCLIMCLTATGAVGEELFHQEESGLIADGVFPKQAEHLDVMAKAKTDGFEEYVLSQLKALSAQIEVSQFGLTRAQFSETYWHMLNMHPEYFYVAGQYSYYVNGGIVTKILPTYRYSASSIPQRMKNFESSVDKVVAHAKKAGTQVGQLLRAYDYFCANFAYDLDYKIYQPDDFFTKKKGVCNAYTLAYCAVLNKLGIVSDMTTSESMNHIWNLVKLGGKWYHVDVTWGDPVSDMPLRATHDNFLRSDRGITAAGHYGWATSIKASSTKYDNYFWQSISYPLSMQGDTIYYVSNDFDHPQRTIYAHDLKTGSTTAFYRYTYTGDGSYYRDYNPVWVIGSDIYYTTGNALYYTNILDGTATRVLSTGSGTTIWGMDQDGDTLKLYAAKGYKNNGKIHTYSLSMNCDISLDKGFIKTTVGKKTTMKYTLIPDAGFDPKITWSFDPAREGYATMDGNRLVALKPGLVNVTATLPNEKSDTCLVLIRDDTPLRLPSGTKVIDEETFRNIGAAEVIVPNGVNRIESNAFTSCEKLRLVELPDSLTYIAWDAFDRTINEELCLLVTSENSYGARYARENKIRYLVVK